MKQLLSLLVTCVAAAATAHAVMAHGGHDERIKIRMADGRLVFETYISAKILKPFDRDGDGILTAGEFQDNASEIRSWIGSHIIVQAEGGTRLDPVFFDTPISEGNMKTRYGEIKFVRVRQHYDYDLEGNAALNLTISLFEEEGRSVILFKDGNIYRKNFPAGTLKITLDGVHDP